MATTDQNANARDILLRMGIGDFNATMIVPLMFMGPAQTDPDITASKLLVKQMQKIMQTMGASWVAATHYLDQPTAGCLAALAGPHWSEHPWFELCKVLLDARDHGKRFAIPAPGRSVELSGMGLLSELPDVPGGPIVLGIGAYLAYRYFTKGKIL